MKKYESLFEQEEFDEALFPKQMQSLIIDLGTKYLPFHRNLKDLVWKVIDQLDYKFGKVASFNQVQQVLQKERII